MREIFKFSLPLMGAFMLCVLLWGDEQKLWAVPVVLLIALYLTAADLRFEGKHAYYRYFFRWRKVPGDIADARCTLLYPLGYIRFQHFFPPLGILVFIVERGDRMFLPFRRTASMQAMLSLPRARPHEPVPRPADHCRNTGDGEKQWRVKRGAWRERKARVPRCGHLHPVAVPDRKAANESRVEKAPRRPVPARVLSSIIGLVAGILAPVPWQHAPAAVGQGFLSHFLRLQQNPAILCAYIGVLMILSIRNRNHEFVNFALAFLIGGIVAFLVHLH